MQKIRIRLPATITGLGPAFHSLGLALRLYTTVQISQQPGYTLDLQHDGPGFDGQAFLHPVVRGLSRAFQRQERAVLGLSIQVDNAIPPELGASVAWHTAGVMGANFLLGSPDAREHVLALSAESAPVAAVIAAVDGGLGLAAQDEAGVVWRTLPAAPLTLVAVVPHQADYRPPRIPITASAVARLPLFIEALRQGDRALLARLGENHALHAHMVAQVPGYTLALELADHYQADLVLPVNGGPAFVIFLANRQQQLAEDLTLALRGAGITAQAWAVPVDTQGVVISQVQSTQ
jgi:homoserine kinase